jgi:signal transduction histidine kinase/DNA-binding NarL/FixJ family response regulator
MQKLIKVLLLEDSSLDAELIKRELIKGFVHHEMLVVRDKGEFEKALHDFPAEIILSDHSLPNFSSHEALKMILEAGINIPFILITSTMTDEFAVKIMKEGANDYIIKDRLSRLPSAVINLVEKFRVINEQTADRIRINEALNRLNLRLQLATKSANLGIWDWNIITDSLQWDEGMYLIYDINDDHSKSIYDLWVEMIHPEDLDQMKEGVRLALLNEKKYEVEFRVLNDNQYVQTIRATGTVEWNDAGIPVRMIGINWDITKERLAAAEREEIIGEMSRRNAELEQFGYIVSHNLRAPVANIIGASTAMDDPELDPEDRAIFCKAVHQSAMSLDQVIRDLNHILAIKTSSQSKELVSFSDLTDDINLAIVDTLVDTAFTITYDFSAVDVLLTVKAYLYSIFYNLIANSVKYRRKGIISHLSIKSHLNDGKIMLVFADNGIGIDLKKNKANIFGLYKRFNFDFPGKGMGLFMVKSQMELLGGTITVESIENTGTKFKLEFSTK